MSHCVFSLLTLLHPGFQETPATPGFRPWADVTSLNDEYEKRLATAADAAAKLDLAGWCAGNALFIPMQALLETVIRDDADQERARSLLRHVKAGDRWVPEELTRFDEKPPADRDRLAPLTPVQEKELLKFKDQPFRVLGSSGVFDLRSDLTNDAAELYHKAFSSYYRTLKQRFRVWVGSKVDVLVFANRADYLRFYRDYVGTGGEHVLGFYSNRNLVLYDDPSDRPRVINTARHECTHLIADLYFDGADVPGWLDEGMACYFAGECDQALGTYTAGLFDVIRESIAAKKVVRFEEVMRRPYAEFGFNDYAMSWSWVHFLNAGIYEEQFQEFLASVQKLPRDAKNPAAFAKSVTDRFLEKFPVATLENAWREYFTRQFALTSPQQTLDFARFLVMDKGFETHPARERAVDTALRAIGNVLEGDAELRVAAMLLRLEGLDGSMQALRLALRVIRDRILELPGGPDGNQAIVKAELAGRALRTIQEKLAGGRQVVPFDLRSRLLADCGRVKPQDAEALRAIVATCDELVTIARDSVAAALALDPLSRSAIFTWLLLSVDVAPQGLTRIFLRLKLLLEVEPDDRNLAAFALCYLALGDPKWARKLWEDAKAQSLHPESLGRFKDYFESR